MRRLLAIATLLLATGVVAVLGTGANDEDSGDYRVRAIFRNAFTVIKGLDVKVAGVKVGSVESLDVTPDKKAAVVLKIDLAGFKDFRKDAECTIRPQSLIGEKFIECTPTVPKATGQPESPKLEVIEEGEGKGQYLLPVDNTSRPIDLDLVNNVLRLPYRQRLSIILNELGAGLAGRGEDLQKIIRNADPALKETDKVLNILASQNKVLEDLAVDGDQILGPLARERAKVADFIVQANTTAQATAEKRDALEENIATLPEFLRELKPTMVRLGALSDEMTPVLRDLGAQAPAINRFIKQLGPFSEASRPAFSTLGDAADTGRDALVKAKPIVEDLRTFAASGKPLTKNLAETLTSLRDTSGVERLMDYLFYQVAAVNGFDSLGHYLRAILVVNLCSTYTLEQGDPACTANFNTGDGAGSSRLASMPTVEDVNAKIANGRSPYLARMDAVLRGLDPEAFEKKDEAAKSSRKDAKADSEGAVDLPSVFLPGQSSDDGAAQQPKVPQPGKTSAPGGAPTGDPTETLLDYLLGGEGS